MSEISDYRRIMLTAHGNSSRRQFTFGGSMSRKAAAPATADRPISSNSSAISSKTVRSVSFSVSWLSSERSARMAAMRSL